MNPLTQFLLVQDHHRQLLAEAENERRVCCPPRKIRVVFPVRPAASAGSAACLTC